MLHIRVYDENPRWWFGFLNKVAFRQTTEHDGIILYGEEGKDFRVAVAKYQENFMIESFIIIGFFVSMGYLLCMGVNWVRRKFNG